jgi:hypothetical protein
LVQSAWAAVNEKGSYLRAQFYRIMARRGAKKAIKAVAASMALITSTVAPRHNRRVAVRRLADLGYHVTLAPRAS